MKSYCDTQMPWKMNQLQVEVYWPSFHEGSVPQLALSIEDLVSLYSVTIIL